jgi:hypothetical protein
VRLWLPRVAFAAVALLVFLEVFTIAPRIEVLVLVAAIGWLAAPGVVLVNRVLGAGVSGRIASWLIGPALGLGLSVFGLLLFWAAGLQSWLAVVLAPLLSWLLVLAAIRLGGPTLRLPQFDRRDIVAVCLVLLIVPVITFAPYDHVREPTRDGDAYRAYFTADFVWAMTVTAEITKGDVPPVNPFLRGAPLRYYWMSHLLSGAFYRNVRGWGVTAEQVILLDGLAFGLFFVAFFYALARIAGASAVFAALGVIVGFTANSYEGLERILLYLRNGTPLDYARLVNIDAVTRWYYHGMPVDGLQRMLLYQPHHLTGYMFALAALWLVGFAEDITETAVAVWTGILLGLSFLFSTFIAIIIGFAIGLLFAYRVLQRRAWSTLWQSAILGGLPVVVAIMTTIALGYNDPREGMLLQFGLNPVATTLWPFMLLLSFGPLLVAGIAGFAHREWITREGAAAAALAIAALFFYFMVDVPDEGGVWVGWRSGHLLLIAFSVMGAAVLTMAWRRAAARVPLIVAVVVLLVPAVPTVAIDVYNAQDITNREPGPSFPWTVVITPPEREALDWIRQSTPLDAVVQVAPRAHGSATWTYIQAFAERRSVAGEPGSMIPRQRYQYATDEVTFGIFLATRANDALEMARFLDIDFLVVAPPDRQIYPGAAEMFAENPSLFVPVFKNDAVVVYDVRKR